MKYLESSNIINKDYTIKCTCFPYCNEGGGYFKYEITQDSLGIIPIGDILITNLFKGGIEFARKYSEDIINICLSKDLNNEEKEKKIIELNKNVEENNKFGEKLFKLQGIVKNSSLFSFFVYYIAEKEKSLPVEERLVTKTLWNIFSSKDSYKNIFKTILSIDMMKHLSFMFFNK